MVLPDYHRVQFWLDNKENIAKTIYVKAIIVSMGSYVGEGRFDRFEEAMTMCDWVISHPDRVTPADVAQDAKSGGHIELALFPPSGGGFYEGLYRGGT